MNAHCSPLDFKQTPLKLNIFFTTTIAHDWNENAKQLNRKIREPHWWLADEAFMSSAAMLLITCGANFKDTVMQCC